jgi:branched-chain amino acid transport system permease protein
MMEKIGTWQGWKPRSDRAFVGAFILLAIVPIFIREAYLLNVIILALVFSVLCVSWNVILGYAGMFTFGHQAFFGLGAYVSAILSMKAGVSPWWGLLIGGCGAALVSFLIGLPCLRLRAAPYIAIATLSFAEIMRVLCTNLVGLTRGELGLWGIPHFPEISIPLLGTVSFSGGDRVPYYYLILFIFAVTMLVIHFGSHSHFGLAFRAIGGSQDAAESLGVNVTANKLLAFMVSAFFAGVAGSFYAHYLLILTPSSILSVAVMVDVVIFTFLGGLGTFMGPVFGAVVMYIGLEELRILGDYRLLTYGILLVVVVLFMPKGVAPKLFREKKLLE